MKKALNVLSLCLAVALISTPALAGGNLNFSLGQRSLDSNDFEPVDDQTYFGATIDWNSMEWPVNLAGGLYFSSEQESVGSTDITASVIEATFGVMKTWGETKVMHPFLGGGLGFVQVEAEIDDPLGNAKEDDTAPAFYTEGGVYWSLSHAFNLGVSGRFMTAPGIEIEGENFDTTYFQVGILAGWAFSRN